MPLIGSRRVHVVNDSNDFPAGNDPEWRKLDPLFNLLVAAVATGFVAMLYYFNPLVALEIFDGFVVVVGGTNVVIGVGGTLAAFGAVVGTVSAVNAAKHFHNNPGTFVPAAKNLFKAITNGTYNYLSGLGLSISTLATWNSQWIAKMIGTKTSDGFEELPNSDQNMSQSDLQEDLGSEQKQTAGNATTYTADPKRPSMLTQSNAVLEGSLLDLADENTELVDPLASHITTHNAQLSGRNTPPPPGQ